MVVTLVQVADSGSSFAPFRIPDRELPMPPNPSEPSNRDPLQKLLDDSENELRRRLEDACEAEAKGVSTESTEEIRRLEDNLLAAALAAKQTVALRSHMKRRAYTERERPIILDVGADRDTQARAPRSGKPESSVDERGTQDVAMGVREFTDDEGRSWRAWSVVPGLSRASSSGGQFLGGFQNGWICFEGLDVSARRRLPYPRAKWPNISDEELRHLLQQAVNAPLRQKKAAAEARIDR